jgi:hypothetical protein
MNVLDTLQRFCQVRNHNPSFTGSKVPTPRVEFLLKELDAMGLTYELDKFPAERGWRSQSSSENDNSFYYNIYVNVNNLPAEYQGESVIFLAHHDVNNPALDNTNDNSASIINLLYLATLIPGKNVFLAFTDCEEFGGAGADRLATKINEGKFGTVKYAVNLELTAFGEHLLVGNASGSFLMQKVISIDPTVDVTSTPFHDGVVLRRAGIDSTVLGILPKMEGSDKLDYRVFGWCHRKEDHIGIANEQDMKNFVENILVKLA